MLVARSVRPHRLHVGGEYTSSPIRGGGSPLSAPPPDCGRGFARLDSIRLPSSVFMSPRIFRRFSILVHAIGIWRTALTLTSRVRTVQRKRSPGVRTADTDYPLGVRRLRRQACELLQQSCGGPHCTSALEHARRQPLTLPLPTCPKLAGTENPKSHPARTVPPVRFLFPTSAPSPARPTTDRPKSQSGLDAGRNGPYRAFQKPYPPNPSACPPVRLRRTESPSRLLTAQVPRARQKLHAFTCAAAINPAASGLVQPLLNSLVRRSDAASNLPRMLASQPRILATK